MSKKKKKKGLSPPLSAASAKLSRAVGPKLSKKVHPSSGDSRSGGTDPNHSPSEVEAPLQVTPPTSPVEVEPDLQASVSLGTESNRDLEKSQLGISSLIPESPTPQSTGDVSSSPHEVMPTPKVSDAGCEIVPRKKWSNLFSASAQLEEIGTPTQHVSGAPFVLIPDENLESAKEEFKDFIFARCHGDCPSLGRIIGVLNVV